MELSGSYAKLGNNIKSGSFARAASTIKDSALLEINESAELGKLRGIGPSTVKEINEFLEKGTSERLEKLKEELQQIDEVGNPGSALDNIRNLIKKAKSSND